MNENNIQSNGENRSQSGELITMPVAIVIASVVLGGSIVYSTLNGGFIRSAGTLDAVVEKPVAQEEKGPNVAAIKEIRERDVILGDPKAKVTIIEYADYQCPFCARHFNQTESLIKDEYVKSGKVKMIYRDFPFLGPESVAAAESAECAKDQGKFWAYHDALYVAEGVDGQEHNGNLNKELFVKLANSVGMNISDFTKCIEEGRYKKVVADELSLASKNGINSTPISIVGDQVIQGAQSYAQFKSIIEAELKK